MLKESQFEQRRMRAYDLRDAVNAEPDAAELWVILKEGRWRWDPDEPPPVGRIRLFEEIDELLTCSKCTDMQRYALARAFYGE